MSNLSNFVSMSNGNANTLGGHSADYFIENSGNDSWLVKTENYTANSGDMIIADTTNSSFTITLPIGPNIGDLIKIAQGAKPFSVNNLIVARNGKTIMGVADDLLLDVDESFVELVYDGSDWRIV